jgi:hypothetical protein
MNRATRSRAKTRVARSKTAVLQSFSRTVAAAVSAHYGPHLWTIQAAAGPKPPRAARAGKGAPSLKPVDDRDRWLLAQNRPFAGSALSLCCRFSERVQQEMRREWLLQICDAAGVRRFLAGGIVVDGRHEDDRTVGPRRSQPSLQLDCRGPTVPVAVARGIVCPRPFLQTTEIIDPGIFALRGKPVTRSANARVSGQSWPANFVTPDRTPPAAAAGTASGTSRSTGFCRWNAAGGGRPGA